MQDKLAREKALDPNASFIIQAPAGSGKTELLTQRFLTLLGLCQEPEEILAVTFTKKAAGEMKHRLVHALQKVNNGFVPTSAHEEKTHALARVAVLQNEKLGWDLDKNPSRLKIITIDSLASSLTQNLPLLSSFGAEPTIIEDATPLYRDAIEQLLPHLELENDKLGNALKYLLSHLDNRVDVLVRLCITLLSKREQWLPYIMYAKSESQIKAILEHALEHVALETIERVENSLEMYLPEIKELALYAARHILDEKNEDNESKQNPLLYCLNVDAQTLEEKRNYWLGLVSLLLTQAGEFRKTVNKNQGFYPKSHFKEKEEQAVANILKDNMIELVGTLAQVPQLAQELSEVNLLPPLSFERSQWEILESIIELMPILCANLKVVFQSEGKIDFVELSMAATTALGTPDAPSELALALDYQIKHILIDEFQDTSEIQYDLFSKLIQEWQPGEGRSLFLVGDPMQSIYRFRGAEVGVFLRAKQYGLANIPLEYLSLSQNFRSSPKIVDWVNECGFELFPAKEDIAKGAIAYLPSGASRVDLIGQIHCLGFEEDKSEFSSQTQPQPQSQPTAMVNTIVSKINALVNNSQKVPTIAVLVRYRQHAFGIMQHLKQAGVLFEAIDMFPLVKQAYIQDLIVLIRAMTQLSDRIAWVALLRTPFVGFSLSDMGVLAGYPFDELIYNRLERCSELPLSPEGINRCKRVFPILQRWYEQRGRLGVADWIKGLWMALGGPCFLKMDLEAADLNHFFNIVGEFESQNRSFLELEGYLERQFAQSEVKASVQIMTIHKAKGLEFDHVFIPNLEARPRSEDHQLFLWMHQSHGSAAELFMAPIRSSRMLSDPIYRYVEHKLKQKLDFESGRLLYVAMTRAREHLYLCANVTKQDKEQDNVNDYVNNNSNNNTNNNTNTNNIVKGYAAPTKGSFLSKISKAVFGRLELISSMSSSNTNNSELVSASERLTQAKGISYTRFSDNWQLPNILSDFLKIEQPLKEDNVQGELPPLWHVKEQALSPDTLRHIGTLVHQLLYRAVTIGLEAFKRQWPRLPLDTLLKSLGVPQSERQGATEWVVRAVDNTLACPKGQWILSEHESSKAEWALWSSRMSGQVKIILDRAFIDQGTQWVIDYKVIHNNTPTPADWSEVTELYRPQLQSYAKALQAMGRGRIRTGLYFPIQAHWIELS